MNKLDLVKTTLDKLQFEISYIAKKNENGPDLWVLKNGKPYSVEVKKCRITARKSVQVPPVEKSRINDDFILIIHPTGYVLFEKMRDHLKNCTRSGLRTLWN